MSFFVGGCSRGGVPEENLASKLATTARCICSQTMKTQKLQIVHTPLACQPANNSRWLRLGFFRPVSRAELRMASSMDKVFRRESASVPTEAQKMTIGIQKPYAGHMPFKRKRFIFWYCAETHEQRLQQACTRSRADRPARKSPGTPEIAYFRESRDFSWPVNMLPVSSARF